MLCVTFVHNDMHIQMSSSYSYLYSFRFIFVTYVGLVLCFFFEVWRLVGKNVFCIECDTEP